MPRLSDIPDEPMLVDMDTQEQRPWIFPAFLVSIIRRKLKQGDYALHGDDFFAIERKSLEDFVGSITDPVRWERLQNEMQRMAEAGYCARVIVVEGEIDDIYQGRYTGQMPVHLILSRMYELVMDGVCVLFAGNAEKAMAIGYGLLKLRDERLKGE